MRIGQVAVPPARLRTAGQFAPAHFCSVWRTKEEDPHPSLLPRAGEGVGDRPSCLIATGGTGEPHGRHRVQVPAPDELPALCLVHRAGGGAARHLSGDLSGSGNGNPWFAALPSRRSCRPAGCSAPPGPSSTSARPLAGRCCSTPRGAEAGSGRSSCSVSSWSLNLAWSPVFFAFHKVRRRCR